MKISVVSGGFDPIHSGHISYIKSAKAYGDYLIIALNSDQWLVNKKGKAFMPFEERKSVLENLKEVDEVIDFDDDELGSATQALVKIKNMYPESEINFCNGGDRGHSNTPETMGFANNENVIFEYGVGGTDKLNSSSWILHNYFNRQRKLLGI